MCFTGCRSFLGPMMRTLNITASLKSGLKEINGYPTETDWIEWEKFTNFCQFQSKSELKISQTWAEFTYHFSELGGGGKMFILVEEISNPNHQKPKPWFENKTSLFFPNKKFSLLNQHRLNTNYIKPQAVIFPANSQRLFAENTGTGFRWQEILSRKSHIFYVKLGLKVTFYNFKIFPQKISC